MYKMEGGKLVKQAPYKDKALNVMAPLPVAEQDATAVKAPETAAEAPKGSPVKKAVPPVPEQKPVKHTGPFMERFGLSDSTMKRSK